MLESGNIKNLDLPLILAMNLNSIAVIVNQLVT